MLYVIWDTRARALDVVQVVGPIYQPKGEA